MGLWESYGFLDEDHREIERDDEGNPKLTFARFEDGEFKEVIKSFKNIDEWCDWAPGFYEKKGWNLEDQVGYKLSRNFSSGPFDSKKYTKDWFFWRLRFLEHLGISGNISSIEEGMKEGRTVNVVLNNVWKREYGGFDGFKYAGDSGTIEWHPTWEGENSPIPDFHPLIGLVHELSRAADFAWDGEMFPNTRQRENIATSVENTGHIQYNNKVPGWPTMQLR